MYKPICSHNLLVINGLSIIMYYCRWLLIATRVQKYVQHACVHWSSYSSYSNHCLCRPNLPTSFSGRASLNLYWSRLNFKIVDMAGKL